METAYTWGVKHNACDNALEERKKYASQAEWYKACDRGDWLLWQLQHANLEASAVKDINRVAMAFATRYVEKHALHCGAMPVERWANKWLSGDRSLESVRVAAAEAGVEWAVKAAVRASGTEWAAASAARATAWATGAACTPAWAEELKLQADEIHEAIPEWPGDKI